MSTDPFSDKPEKSDSDPDNSGTESPKLPSNKAGQNRQIGRYILQDRLGSGGTATVYQAFDQVTGQSVALKVLPSSADENTLERFRREAMTSGGLRHPHIVRTIQVGVASQGGDIAYIAMELIEGEGLAQLLTKRGRLSPEESCSLLAPIASALAYAHDEGIVHRDVKPSNILLKPVSSSNPTSVQLDLIDHPIVPMLSDFGIARALDAPELTASGRTVGTPAYMAPEQCRGGLDIDGRADIYALAAVLFRCLVGRQPFLGNTPQILHAHVYEPLKIEDDIYRRLSPLVVEILQQGMAKKPEERYENAHQLAEALATAAGITLTSEMSTEEVASELTPTVTLTSLDPVDEPPTISETVIIPAAGTVASSVETISGSTAEADTAEPARTILPGATTRPIVDRPAADPQPDTETASSIHIFEQTDTDEAAYARPTFAQRLEQIRWGRIALASTAVLLFAIMLALLFRGGLNNWGVGNGGVSNGELNQTQTDDQAGNVENSGATEPTEDASENLGSSSDESSSDGSENDTPNASTQASDSATETARNEAANAQRTAEAAALTATAAITLTTTAEAILTTAAADQSAPQNAAPNETQEDADNLPRFIPSPAINTPLPPPATATPLPATPVPPAPVTNTPVPVFDTPVPTPTWTPKAEESAATPEDTPVPPPAETSTETPIVQPTPTWTPAN